MSHYLCKQVPFNFWSEGLSFYFDSVSFAHKLNPLLDATAPPTDVTQEIKRVKVYVKGKRV